MRGEEQGKHRLVLGSNVVLNAGTSVVLRGDDGTKEIARFSPGDDGSMLVSAKVEDANSEEIARISDSEAEYVREGFEVETGENRIVVRSELTGAVHFEYEYIDDETLKLNGIFWFGGGRVVAKDDGLTVGDTSVRDRSFNDMEEVTTLIRQHSGRAEDSG